MRPLLFYWQQQDCINDTSHKTFLEDLLGVGIETYPIKEHREEYDHNNIPEYFPGTDTKMPATCWCEIPNLENPSWSKLHFNGEKIDGWWGTRFVADGDNIFNLEIDNIHKKYGINFSGPGPWEIV